MKIETGSPASLASVAALAVSIRLASAALAAASAAAAASCFAFKSALAASSCVPSASALAAAFCRASSAACLCLVNLGPGQSSRVGIGGGSERLLGASKLGIGARLERLEIAHRSRRRGGLALCRRERGLGGGRRLGGIVRIAGQRFGARRHGVDHILLRHEQRRIGKRDRLRVGRRDDHPHPHRRLVEHLLGEIERHAHAAVRGRVAGQRAAVQRDAVPGDAQHVRHPGIVIHARVVILVLLDDGEDAGRRLASGRAGRYRRAQDPAVGVVEGHVLALDRHDRHDRFGGRARRRHLGGARGARLPGGGGRLRASAPPWLRPSRWRQMRGSPHRDRGWIASVAWSFHSSVEAEFPGQCPKIDSKVFTYGSDSRGLPEAAPDGAPSAG